MGNRPGIAILWLAATLTFLPAAAVELTYVGNEGFLLEAGGKKVLIDSLYRDGVGGYVAHSAELRERLETASEPFDDIDLVLATHFHPDHFDADAVARFLAHDERPLFVSTPQAIERLRSRLDEDDPRLERLRAVLPPEGERRTIEHRGIRVELLNLHHGRERPFENLGFLIHLGDERILHVGDTEADADDFAALDLAGDRIDVGLIPFWLLLEPKGRKAIAEMVAPARLVAIHVPPPEPRQDYIERLGGWRTMVEKRLEEQAGALVFRRPLERRKVAAPAP